MNILGLRYTVRTWQVHMAYREHTGPLTVNTEYGLTVHTEHAYGYREHSRCTDRAHRTWLTVNILGH